MTNHRQATMATEEPKTLDVRKVMNYARFPRVRISFLLLILASSLLIFILVLQEDEKSVRSRAQSVAPVEYGIQEGDPDPEMIDMMEEFNNEWADQLGYSRKILHKHSDIKHFSLYVSNDKIDHFKVVSLCRGFNLSINRVNYVVLFIFKVVVCRCVCVCVCVV